MNSKEQYSYRQVVGQLNWISTQTRPDLAYDVCQLSAKLNTPTIRDLIKANKVLKRAKATQVSLKFKKLISPLHLLSYCDASFANLPDGSSQGGMLIFMADDHGNTSPLFWSSRKLRRVCRSTLTAETMAMLDTVDSCVWLSHIINEICDDELKTTIIRTDCMSLKESIYSTTPIHEEKRLRVEIAAIRQSTRNNEIRVEWIDKEHQLADSLTKQGADSTKLLKTLYTGRI